MPPVADALVRTREGAPLKESGARESDQAAAPRAEHHGPGAGGRQRGTGGTSTGEEATHGFLWVYVCLGVGEELLALLVVPPSNLR